MSVIGNTAEPSTGTPNASNRAPHCAAASAAADRIAASWVRSSCVCQHTGDVVSTWHWVNSN
jgi:hypothetical protein